jgi:hypothetical protein
MHVKTKSMAAGLRKLKAAAPVSTKDVDSNLVLLTEMPNRKKVRLSRFVNQAELCVDVGAEPTEDAAEEPRLLLNLTLLLHVCKTPITDVLDLQAREGHSLVVGDKDRVQGYNPEMLGERPLDGLNVMQRLQAFAASDGDAGVPVPEGFIDFLEAAQDQAKKTPDTWPGFLRVYYIAERNSWCVTCASLGAYELYMPKDCTFSSVDHQLPLIPGVVDMLKSDGAVMYPQDSGLLEIRGGKKLHSLVSRHIAGTRVPAFNTRMPMLVNPDLTVEFDTKDLQQLMDAAPKTVSGCPLGAKSMFALVVEADRVYGVPEPGEETVEGSFRVSYRDSGLKLQESSIPIFLSDVVVRIAVKLGATGITIPRVLNGWQEFVDTKWPWGVGYKDAALIFHTGTNSRFVALAAGRPISK